MEREGEAFRFARRGASDEEVRCREARGNVGTEEENSSVKDLTDSSAGSTIVVSSDTPAPGFALLAAGILSASDGHFRPDPASSALASILTLTRGDLADEVAA